MKKRALSLLLTLTMLLSLVPAFGVSAAATDFTGWTEITGTTTISTGGNYYLNSDVTGNITVNSGVTATLDLNGYVLKGTGSGSVITNNGTLTISDSNPDAAHYFEYVKDGSWVATDTDANAILVDEIATSTNTGAIIKVTGGCITGGTGTSNNGGAIYSAAAKKYEVSLTITGGNIVGNKAVQGGGVYSQRYSKKGTTNEATFKMTGGSVVGNAAIGSSSNALGGGLYLNGKVSLSGSSVSYNTSLCSSNANKNRACGGGLYIDIGSTVSSAISNTKFCGNTAKATSGCLLLNGGGVFIAKSDFTGEYSFADCVVEGNQAVIATSDGGTTTTAVRGGGVYSANSLKLTGNTIIKNNLIKIDTEKNGTCSRNGYGGGIFVSGNESTPTTLTVKDQNVKITGNKIDSTYKAQGGGVHISENSKFIMTAGTISENSVKADTAIYDEAEGGGLCITYSSSEFIVGGTAKITGNTGSNDTANNVYLRKDTGKEAVITVASGTDAPVSTGAEKMFIGVTVAASYKDDNGEYKDTVFPQAITQSDSSDFSSYFTADDNTDYEVRNYKNGTTYLVKLATTPAVCEITSDGNFKDNQYSTIAEALTDAGTTKTTIKLLRDVTENVTIIAGADITLDLNGKVLDLNGKHIVNKGTLTIADSNPTSTHTGTLADYAGGIITDGNGADIDGVLDEIGGAIVVVKDGSDAALTMSAGTIVNCSAKNGGAIFVGEGASFTMNGGKIVKCSAERGGGISNYKGTVFVFGTVESCTAQNYGGGIYNDGDATAKVTLNNGADIKNCAVLEGNENDLLGGGVYNKGTLIMNTGAVIEGCSAEKGAGVHNDGNTWVTFTMNGGEIKNNTAKRTDGGKSTGGGVQVSANSTFTMLGGTVTGNKTNATTQYGAGIYNKGTMTVGGAANITGNLHSNGITASNLCVATGKTVAVSAETVPTTMSIGISTETAPLGGNPAQPVQFGAVNSTDYSSHFTSDNGAYSVVYEDTAGTKDLRLKQTVFYVIDNVDGNNGSDTTGNGTSAKPYLTIQKAAEKASGTSVIKLLSGIKLDANASLPDNTTIMINGKTVEAIGDNRISGTNITVLVYDLADFTAANTFVKALADGTSCTFKLMNNIEISEALKLNGDIGNVIFDGNGKTITAVRDNFGKSEHAFSIKNEATSARSFTLKNATVNVNDGFRYGLYLEGKKGVINATVENVTINMNQTVAPRNSTGETTTAIIMDNYANVTIKSSFTANTNQFCWTAINVCAEKRNASLTFDTNANVSITDNRTDANKKAKMFIAFDGNTTNTCTATGKYITDNLVAAGTVGYNPPATVTFESNGGSDVAQKITAKYWYVEKPADNPTKSNNTFGGWYSDVACENAWNFANDKVTGATTLYAKWIQNSVEKAVVTGTVTDGSNPVNGAVVELRLGTEKVAAANTNASGTYTFDNVENGIYNIVVTKDGKTKTTVVNVNEASSFTVAPVVMPAKAVSSKVELKNTDTIAETAKANAASVVVGGVDEIAEAITPSGTDKITIALTVEPKAADASNTQQTAIKTKSGGKNVEFLDLTLTKQVNDAAPSDIGSTNSKLLTINVPFDTTGVDISSITVYRYHGTAAETFTQITNVADKADGKFMVNDDYISIYAEKFSTYAIGYINAASNGGSASYAVTANAATHGSITANTKNASVGSTVTLTVKPDKGYTLETLTVKDAKGNEVTLTAVKLGETYTFKMPSSTVTVSATFKVVQGNIFIDVYASDYYFDAVQWAAENGITSGVDATHFAPNDITTRGQMVTFLWRAAGCPEPTTTTCAFTDLKADEFYYKAVLWGCEKGLIKGYDATTFAPDDNVTRGQTVAFLARYEGVKDEATGYTHGFSDVAASDYYNNAVAWAATNKVTEGTSATTFAPNDSCLRAQIVTFIYRNFAK